MSNKHPSDDCYETIMFGWVTHMLHAASMRVRSLFYLIHIL